MIKISHLTIDPEIQLQARGMDANTVTGYVEAISSGAKFPPIIVYSDNGTLLLSDGFHRVEACRFLGLAEIAADIRPGTREDAMVHAAIANVANGRPMSQAQKREAGERLLKMTDWSDPKIARELAVSNETVRQWRLKLLSSNLLEDRPTSTVTRGGTTYMMDVSAIGKRADQTKLDSMTVHYSSETPEWYTPPQIIERVLKVMGKIDLDPCSNSQESPNVPALRHYTKDDDGLSQRWHGRAYMNPPYGREVVNWVNYLCKAYEQGHVSEAISLLPARTDTEWFRRLRQYPRCFIWGRLRFSGNETGAPFPSMAVYLGKNVDGFKEAFGDIGDIYVWSPTDRESS